MLRTPLPALLLLFLTACAGLLPSAERIQVQQGNLLDAADIAALERGMSRAAVRERIGAPVIAESFNRDRWDYIYYSTEAGRPTGEIQRLSLYFDGERLARIEDQYSPPAPPEPEELPEMPDEDEPVPGEPMPGGEPPPPGSDPMPSPSPGEPGRTPGL